MATSTDRGKLDSELEGLDLPTLKKRRKNARRSATRCETFLRELESCEVKDLDLKTITSHLEKIHQDIKTLDALHDAIMDKITEEEGETEEASYTADSAKRLKTSNALAELAEATHLYSRCKVIKHSLDRYSSLPKLDSCNIRPALDDLKCKLDEMEESAVTIKGRPELQEGILILIRDLLELQIRNGKDWTDSTIPTSAPPTGSTGLSKFERLPRLALPEFDGTPIGWRPFWEKFQNALSKDTGLTVVDKLAFLNMAVKGKEAKLIIESVTRSGPDFDGAIQALQDRYDQPRQTCRTSLQSVLNHKIDLSSEGITKTITLFQTSLAVVKECTDGSVDALYTALCELLMPEKLFQNWVEESAKLKITPAFDHLSEYLRRYQMRFCGRTDTIKSNLTSNTSGRTNFHRPRSATQPSTLHVQGTRSCPLCPSDTHPLYLCDNFKAQSVEERQSTTSRLKVCANCLSPSHFLRECPSTRSCCHCGRKHHSLLHRYRKRNNQQQIQPTSTSSGSTTGTASSGSASNATSSGSTANTSAHALPSIQLEHDRPIAFLATCLATVDAGGRIQKARALMDSGSTLSFVTTKLVQRLKAKKIKKQTSFTGISQTSAPNSRYQVDLVLVPKNIGPTIPLRAIVLDRISGDLPGFPLQGVREQPFLQGKALADPKFDLPGSVDLLFGADILDEILLQGHATSANKMTHACETIFGWALRGKVQRGSTNDTVHLCGQTEENKAEESSTDDLLRAFFKVEQAPEKFSNFNEEDQEALDNFQKSHSRNEDGRYIVKLPKRNSSVALGCSRDQALRRYRQNRRSLERKGSYADFEKALGEYELLGHAEPVPLENLRKPECETFYLPAHGVVKNSSTTTKLRIVFDASAKSSTGVSLNDILLPGPNLYPLLTTVILAFRTHPIALCADISKMFREVGLHPEDRDLHRFVQPVSDGKAIRDMRMTRVTFGVTSSPFLATQVLRQLAHDYKEQYPQAANIIRKHFYVDDCLTGADTLEEAINIRENLCKLLSCAGMNLRKWKSNSQQLLNTIPEELREVENEQLISPPDQCLKTLGIHWNTRTDNFHVATPTLSSDGSPTKRKIASDVAKTFDLLGWFSPCIVVVKILLQKLWKEKLDWDEPVPERLVHDWENWKSQLPLITQHPIPRYQYRSGKKIKSQQLHGFSDASDVAYAGVVYLRTEYEDADVTITLLYSKTRVAPLHKMTTPRLELCGAQLLSKLLVHVAEALDIPLSNIYAWSDSTIALSWLSTPPIRLKPYVCNRVMDTIERIPSAQWRHVPTSCNPADVASRGIDIAQLLGFHLWWQGPAWLPLSQHEWPYNTDWKSKKNLSELKPVVHFAGPPQEDISERFSGYNVMLRVITWCFRFALNCRKLKSDRNLSVCLSLDELNAAETRLLTLSQDRNFKSEKTALISTGEVPRQSSLASLRPFLDPRGVMRVGGRLENARNLTQEQKHPIILHHSDRLSKLIARQAHVSNMHVGPQALLAILSLQYHIVGFKQLVKGVSNQCVPCKKAYSRTHFQVMGQLPASRVTSTSVFHHTGADFAGPLMMKRGFTRNRTLVKVYVCLFVCMATKAVHLEMVTDLTSEAFLAALRRFISRRGCPETLTTDNGSNFVGAQKELKDLYSFLNSTDTQKSTNFFCTTHHIKWIHTPARSPHFGGLWEAAVKSMKLLLFKTVKPHSLFEHELNTVLIEIEATLNSRPLIPLDSGPSDGLEVLTPGHFLIGKALKAVPVEMHLDLNLSRLKHWNLCQRIHADFWTRWVKEYLRILQRSNKWCRPQRSMKVGDIVLLKDTDLFVRSWPLGKIIKVYPGTDGYVRTATIKTEKGIYTRSITKLVLLLKEEELTSSSAPGPPVCSGPPVPPGVAPQEL